MQPALSRRQKGKIIEETYGYSFLGGSVVAEFNGLAVRVAAAVEEEDEDLDTGALVGVPTLATVPLNR